MAVRIGGEREVLISPEFDAALRLCAEKTPSELTAETGQLQSKVKRQTRWALLLMLLFFVSALVGLFAIAWFTAKYRLPTFPVFETTAALSVVCLPALYLFIKAQDLERKLRVQLEVAQEALRIHRKGPVMIKVITRAIGGKVVAENQP